MTLTPKQRGVVRDMFGGRCSYCAQVLPAKGWHADHVEPVLRDWWHKHARERWIANGRRGEEPTSSGLGRPQNDRLANIFPACRACNLDKHCMSLEVWRRSLEQRADVCRRNHSAFRHAERFGRVVVVEGPLVFWFEKYLALPAPMEGAGG